MPLCAPVATGNGLFWRTLENYSDSNFCIQQYSGPAWWSDNYRIILSVNSTQVASAKQLDDIKKDWEFVQSRIQEQVTKSGLRVFSEKFLLSFCKHLFKDNTNNNNNTNSIEVPLDRNYEKEAFISNFFAKLRSGEGVGDIIWLMPYSLEWVTWDDENGMTPLHVAVDLKMPDLVKTCIAKGADVNRKDGQGWTPLHFAAYRGDLEICELLIQTGNAAVMSISKDGTLPLHYLVRYSPLETERRKFMAVLESLIKKGAPINAQTKHGETPLHQACLKGAAEAVEFLLDHGADCNVKNNNGETALCFAVIASQKVIVTMLVEHGADCTLGGQNGSALELAKKLDYREIFYFLSGFAPRSRAPTVILPSAVTSQSHSAPTTPVSLSLSSHSLPPHSNSLSLLPSSSSSSSSSSVCSSLTHSNSNGSLSSESSIRSKKQMNSEIFPHSFQLVHFSSLTWCSYCGYFVWGIRRQGYTCIDCQYTVHPKCKKLAVLSETCKVAQEKSSLSSLSSSLSSHHSFSSLSTIPIPNGRNRGSSSLGTSPSSPSRSLSSPSPSSSPSISSESNIKNSSTPPTNNNNIITNTNNTPPSNSDQIIENNNNNNNNNINIHNSFNDTTEDLSEIDDLDSQVPEELDAFKHNFTPEFMDLLYTQFNILDRVQRGYLTRDEFGSTLGTVINDCGLLDALFAAFDQNKDGKIDIREYFVGMSILMNGDLDSQVKFAFAMMDRDGDGYLTRQELTGLTASMHRSLGNVQLVIDRNPDYFTDHLFPKSLDSVSLPQYKEHMLKHLLFVQSLGLLEDESFYEEEEEQQQQQQQQKHNPNTTEDTTQNNNNIKRNKKVIKGKKKRGKMITLGNESWHMVQNLMLGIRQAVGEATYSLEKEELKGKDFDDQVDFKLVNSAGECYWIFKDFAPMVFKKIREVWNIDPKAYMFSLGPEKILGNLLLGNLSALCEVVSTGRSGSLFFKTNDGKYLLKTVPPQEELLARALLPAYHSHVSKFPNMLITKFLGLHTMAKGPMGKQADLRFVVMTNVFDTPLKIHEQYDLKGSTVGRHVDVSENENSDDDEERDAEVALKDLDFKRRIYLGPEYKAILLEQLEQDCKFMEQHNICDYSFLVGVHRIDPKSPLFNSTIVVPPSPKFCQQGKFQPLFQSFYGGIISYDKKEVYFLGIIDTLTTWDLRKKSEKTFKSIFHDSSQISAIAPSPYRARFQKYISSIVD